jgi:hypothetical protein
MLILQEEAILVVAGDGLVFVDIAKRVLRCEHGRTDFIGEL